MYLIERLGQLPVRDGIFSGTLGDSATDFKAQLNKFLDKVRARPQDYKDLLLSARLHPLLRFSRTIANYPVGEDKLHVLTVLADASYELILKDLYKIADAKLQQEIKAEVKLWKKTMEGLKKVGKSKLTQWLVPVALLARKIFTRNTGDYPYVWNTLPEIGRNFAKEFLGSVGEEILKSNASEVHLVNLGWVLVDQAKRFLRTDPAFKKEVEKERKKQASKPK